MNLNFKTMGVMNLTPNSFSDGNNLKSRLKQKRTFQSFLEDFDIIDVGAESTAPFNDPIGAKEELTRLENFLIPLIDSMEDPNCVISIDTYRPEVFFEIALLLNKAWPETSLVFNDISGQCDNDLKLIMESDLEFSYVLSHNLASQRDLASFHMDYVLDLKGENFIKEVLLWFEKRLDFFSSTDKQVILDPCFGFSKSREQNHELLRSFSLLGSKFKEFCIMVGVSRKSFMRFPKDLNPRLPSSQLQLDCLQTLVAHNLLTNNENQLIFRTHNLAPFKALRDAAKIF